MIARIPRELLHESLDRMAALVKDRQNASFQSIAGYAGHLIDIETQARRTGTREDALQIIGLLNHLPHIAAGNVGVLFQDGPPEAAELAAAELFLRHSPKPLLIQSNPAEIAQTIVEMAQVGGNGLSSAKSHPLLYRATLDGPLRLVRSELEAMQIYSKQRHTILIQPCEPVGMLDLSPAETLALHLAGCLGALVYLSATGAESPVVFCSPVHILDKTSGQCLSYAPVLSSIQIAFIQLVRKLRFPVATSAGIGNSFALDFQSGWESGRAGIHAMLRQAALLDRRGLVGDGETFSPLHLLVENEISTWLQAWNREFRIEKEVISPARLEAMCRGEDRLAETPPWQPDLFGWEGPQLRPKKQKDLLHYVQERANNMVAQGPPAPRVDEPQARELDRLVKKKLNILE